MVTIDVVLAGVPIWTSQGGLGQSTVAVVDGRVLLDAGSLTRRDHLLDGLDAAGIDPGDITDVALTHPHWDHCENLDLFPEATVHVHGPQLEAVRRGEFDPATGRSADALLERYDAEPFGLGPVTGGVEAVSTPGHSEHHVSFTFADEPAWLFAGDAIKSASGFPSDRPLAFYDQSLAAETHRRIAEEFEFVVPGHDSPFYVEDGSVVPATNVSVRFDVRFGPGATTSVDLTSDRDGLRPLPDGVNVPASGLSAE